MVVYPGIDQEGFKSSEAYFVFLLVVVFEFPDCFGPCFRVLLTKDETCYGETTEFDESAMEAETGQAFET